MKMERYAVITGASVGLGREFAIRLAKRGYHLVLVARRKERLEKLKKKLSVPCTIITADLGKEEECYRVWNEIKDFPIEVFLNNAGFGDCGVFLNNSLEKELAMIQVNVKAVHIFTKLVLRKMQQQNRGYLLNVASSAGLLEAGPYMAAYYATKSYVTSLTQAVAQELKEKGSPVYVGCLCPGPVDTEFNRVANVEFALKGISSGYCAEYALKQMFRRKVVIVPTLRMKTAIVLSKLSPRSIAVSITAHQQKKKFYQT